MLSLSMKSTVRPVSSMMRFAAVRRRGLLWLACLAAPLGLAQNTFENYAFTTLSGRTNLGFANGAGSAAEFGRCAGVVVDASGNTYIADTGNNVIRKISPAGVAETFAGQPGVAGSTDSASGTPLFSGPIGLALGTDGNLYVTEGSNHTIRKINTTTRIVSTEIGRAHV
jgi:hypothetical protein